MVNRKMGNRSQQINQQFEQSDIISDAQFIDDLQVLLNRESMLKADVAHALGIQTVELDRVLVVVPRFNQLTMPQVIRRRARELRLKKEWGEVWYYFNKSYNGNLGGHVKDDISFSSEKRRND